MGDQETGARSFLVRNRSPAGVCWPGFWHANGGFLARTGAAARYTAAEVGTVDGNERHGGKDGTIEAGHARSFAAERNPAVPAATPDLESLPNSPTCSGALNHANPL